MGSVYEETVTVRVNAVHGAQNARAAVRSSWGKLKLKTRLEIKLISGYKGWNVMLGILYFIL